MGNKGRSERNFGGGYTNYDSKGRKVSTTRPDVFGGGYTTYDAKGKKIGRSDPSFLGGYNHYDAKGKKIGHSDPNGWGGYTSYDSNGHKTSSDPTLSGGYSHNEGGCYVATCVYGSYDCPEVWTLRRFRDEYLAKYALGRAFIRTYYAVSPSIVRKFGRFRRFRDFWKKPLDWMVHKLQENGVKDTMYEDKRWEE